MEAVQRLACAEREMVMESLRRKQKGVLYQRVLVW
jgi:hypothetical protein